MNQANRPKGGKRSKVTKEEYKEYEESVEHYTKGLEAISSGHCPGCEECGCENAETADDCPETEAHFSWSSCDICGSTLGGDRLPFHAILNGKIIHLEGCVDCQYYVAYGQLDDMTMLEMETAETA